MAFFGLFDLLIALALFVFLASSIVLFLLRPRLTGASRVTWVWLLVASLAGTGLFILFNVVYFNGFGTDPVIGSPTGVQVTGTWVGSGGARLVLRPGGLSLGAARRTPGRTPHVTRLRLAHMAGSGILAPPSWSAPDCPARGHRV